MRICILKESLCLGGTERSAANISRVLSREHDVYMTVYDSSKLEYPYGGTLVNLDVPAKDGMVRKVLNTLLRMQKYRHLIARRKMDVLFEFVSINSPISRMWHKNAIRIISSRDFSVMAANTEQFCKCLNNADALVCNSDYLREYYTAHHPEHEGKVFTVYNVIEEDEIRRQSAETVEAEYSKFLSSHGKSIVSVGRFCKEKGFEFLIQAFAEVRKKVKNAGLVLVGDGEYRKNYEALIQRLGVENHVFFTGFQKNPYKYMKRCTCFVLSSLSEGFPNVLPEAMALGLPVIADNCYSGPAEILRKDRDYTAIEEKTMVCDYGILSPSLQTRNLEPAIREMEKAITTLLMDENMQNYLSERSLLRVKEFSSEAAKKKLDEIFRRLKEQKGAADSAL